MYCRHLAPISLLCFTLLLTSCVKEIDEYTGDDNSTGQVTDINQMQVPANFSYANERKINFSLTLKTNTDAPLSGIRISVWTDLPENNGYVLINGSSNSNGIFSTSFMAPKSVKEVIIRTSYIGLPENIPADLSTGSINVTLGGSSPQKIKQHSSSGNNIPASGSAARNTYVPVLSYLGGWNTQGVPNYLSSSREDITASFLSRSNSSLPEYKAVTVHHPQYLSGSSTTEIEITHQAEVWMTYVHEGANNRNTIGYYKYNKFNPPTSVNDISEIKVVFPNLSYINSSGGLVTGDKVSLGIIGPDTIVGLVLLSNAYNISTATVGNGTAQYYTNPALNPETDPQKKNHHVLLWDQAENKMIVGFEESNRSSGSDEDFNDAVIYISTSTSSALSTGSANRSAAPVDTDGDGIDDNSDEYPFDPDLAFNNYYPSDKSFGYLAFEDLWPYKGDYDLNDLLVGYRFNMITDANNDVKEVQSKIFIKAAGGSYQHGLGIEFPVPGYFVETVNGPVYTENYIANNANGTEANQQNAVVIVFDNSNNIAPCQSGYYVNTEPGSPVIASDTVRLAVRFVAGIPQNTLGVAPFNPFIISNKRRGFEIHLPDKPPTALADASLFNTGQDRSNMALGRYYKSENNLPWCINIPAEFPIITEKTSIINAYLHFADWAQSGGTLYPDWYEDKPGYRDNNKLLHR